METKSPPKTRRTLTEEQLGNKRRIDKLKHRENRAENKTRLENIERDVSFLRDTMGDMMLHLRELSLDPAHHHQTPTTSHTGPSPQSLHTLPSQLLCPPKPESWSSSPDPTTPLTLVAPAIPPHVGGGGPFFHPPTNHLTDHLTDRLYAQHVFPQEPLEAQMDMEALLAEIRGESPVVECRCGKQHNADVQCTERISVTMAFEFSNVASQTNMRPMTAPRNPSLQDLLLHPTETSNLIAIIMSSILRQYDFTNIESLCGIFLLSYRLLRATETIADVPPIMRPTRSQITIPHPKSLDFIPFPALRNYLCLNQHKDARHSVDLYLRSMRLVLPPGKSLMTKAERGGIELNPEFEIFASDLRNWTMGSPWSEYFPQLRQFLY
ncbi:hypothetical protein CCM_00831 [Cordyceps militaris CM01]|uniref:BZIP transcription factor n=1 Tax=Cordyceps militaris (strain CM01) TaxID=983644 RepID=G3J6E2_CORMM|nr:uncharacterized protein CCM_00831 [Cordyceps militaris CM01]EGX96176.1 hypothetical protein CCM_00831 [Cordyceps militaris CM01]